MQWAKYDTRSAGKLCCKGFFSPLISAQNVRFCSCGCAFGCSFVGLLMGVKLISLAQLSLERWKPLTGSMSVCSLWKGTAKFNRWTDVLVRWKFCSSCHNYANYDFEETTQWKAFCLDALFRVENAFWHSLRQAGNPSSSIVSVRWSQIPDLVSFSSNRRKADFYAKQYTHTQSNYKQSH